VTGKLPLRPHVAYVCVCVCVSKLYIYYMLFLFILSCYWFIYLLIYWYFCITTVRCYLSFTEDLSPWPVYSERSWWCIIVWLELRFIHSDLVVPLRSHMYTSSKKYGNVDFFFFFSLSLSLDTVSLSQQVMNVQISDLCFYFEYLFGL